MQAREAAQRSPWQRDRPWELRSKCSSAGTWRSQPELFEIEGRRPIPEVFGRALDAWQSIILHPSDVTLVVSHKSVLRAMICSALGLGPAAFRAIDVHNSGVTTFWINQTGEAMLQNMNLTTHLAMPLKY